MPDFPNQKLGIIGGDGDRVDREPPDVMVVGCSLPDATLFRSRVATTYDKHLVEVALLVWRDTLGLKDDADPELVRRWKTHEAANLAQLFASGTDILQQNVAACHRRGIKIVASHRMNAEDYQQHTWRLSDFGRSHPEWRIPTPQSEREQYPEALEFTGALDPAIPEVYDYRMKIFQESIDNYDVDGVELNWRRWFHMISNPLENHTILTQMVRDVRRLLDEAAKRKGRERLLLGVCVGPLLCGDFVTEEFPGALCGAPANMSCEQLGLDVETWIAEGLVDYVRPCLFNDFLPALPRTAEFAALVRNRNVGVYPTVFPYPQWADDRKSISELALDEIADMMRRHRDELCNAALQCYADGADGIAKFNWFTETGGRLDKYRNSLGYVKTLMFVHQYLTSPEALQQCLQREPTVEAHCTDWEPV